MSATNRSGKGRTVLDFYATPKAAVRALLPFLPPLPGLRILEPSAGRGAIVEALIEAGATPSLITAVELDPGRCAVIPDGVVKVCADFGMWTPPHAFDIVITNPPYTEAESHVRRAISMLTPGGTCAALLRLAFLAEGQCRAPFRKAHPHDRIELVERMSFTAESLSWLTEAELSDMRRDIPANPKRGIVAHIETVDEVRARLRATDSTPNAWGLFGEGRGGRFWTVEEMPR